ncbi:GNAT family N-acetyltransferase [Paenibacillus thermotolerans]|uniref:GNAT family N-acetyltransferase n=1 Tax=Paenibacillus thermotolerans TaxID=3027807 RepID=UPI0023687904|nr:MULTISPECIES: GNAT family N-acetyltransferase [unclassified Paenibacillus]
MVEIRMLTDEEMKEAVRLSDSTFRDAEQPSMGPAFPYIFNDMMRHLSFGAFEDGRLISFMGLVPWEIAVGKATLRVFSLGSVCTHPDARGRGVASLVLQNIYEFIKEAGGSLLFVSGGRTLYTRTGCAFFGRVRRFALYKDSVSHIARMGSGDASPVEIREMVPADVYDLKDIASARPVRYEFGVNELSALIKAEAHASCIKMKHRVLVAQRSGRTVGFAVIAVPRDGGKSGLLIEQAGDADAVAQLLGAAVERFAMNGLSIPVAWHETELCSLLEGLPSSEEGHLGTVRIMDADALVAQLRPWLAERNAALAERLRIEERGDGMWAVHAGGETLEVTKEGLVALLFDNANAAQGAKPEAGALSGLFPVPLPYPGGLAYI